MNFCDYWSDFGGFEVVFRDNFPKKKTFKYRKENLSFGFNLWCLNYAERPMRSKLGQGQLFEEKRG